MHFKNLFTIARRWGYDQVELTHVPFGSVLDPETHKPLKTREGEAEALASLLNEAMHHAMRVYEQLYEEGRERGEEVRSLGDAERQHMARVIGIGAVKYADLSQNRASDYDFSYPKMLAMNGNTATYMQYAYVRNRAIFRKGFVDVETLRRDPPPVLLEQAEERALALQMLRFEEALASAAADYRPSQITSYLWDLAKTYNGFFANCKVLRAETPELRQSRLLICDVTARVIQKALGLLGIQTVEEM
jgi:arginyl-tRNA synthetase